MIMLHENYVLSVTVCWINSVYVYVYVYDRMAYEIWIQ